MAIAHRLRGSCYFDAHGPAEAGAGMLVSHRIAPSELLVGSGRKLARPRDGFQFRK